MIEITGTELTDVAKIAYALSQPQGLGFLHYEDGNLSDEEAKGLVDAEESDGRIALSMDYVNGRACKLTVFSDEEKLYISDSWYDHTPEQLDRLLDGIGIKG